MSHQFETGFSVREPMWHGLGTVLSDYPGSWPEAMKMAGIFEGPILVPAFKYAGVKLDGSRAYAPGDDVVVGDYSLDEGYSRLIRPDTGATLSYPSGTWELIDHREFGEIVESVLDIRSIRWETAGVLAGGKAVFALVRLDEPVQLPGDNTHTYPYLAITVRHDGRGGCTLRTTAIRIVCMNTFRAAEAEGNKTGATFTFRHTRNWRDRIEDAREAVVGARKEFKQYEDLARELLGITVDETTTARFVDAFIPMPVATTDRQIRNVEDARTAVRKILASETTAPVAHTAYGLLQASTEYLDWARRANGAETRFARALVRPEPHKARALALIREVTK